MFFICCNLPVIVTNCILLNLFLITLVYALPSTFESHMIWILRTFQYILQMQYFENIDGSVIKSFINDVVILIETSNRIEKN
ncbi:hypothetical protein RIF29_09731 [Crotalaria pallida]|uniref:Uncharacterized protein n=1 Tax=Crotalaria pallida TaxID=3830 RepID=A0AAN9IJK6_CROPI